MDDFERVIYNLADRLDSLIYEPFKKRIAGTHDLGHKKELFKQAIETQINTLRAAIQAELQTAITECCEQHCRFCFQDDVWKWDILGEGCAVAALRKRWDIKDSTSL